MSLVYFGTLENANKTVLFVNGNMDVVFMLLFTNNFHGKIGRNRFHLAVEVCVS